MDLAAGESGTMAFAISNRGAESAPLVLVGGNADLFNPYDGYPLQVAGEPACGQLLPGGPPPFGSGYHLEIGPLAPGQTVHCVIRVTRNADAVNSTAFAWEVYGSNGDPFSHDWTQFEVGTLTDVAISIEPVSLHLEQGVARGLVRLRARNNGPSDVASFNVGACTDVVYPPFYIDNAIPNGCAAGSILCFDSGFAFALPTLPAGQSESCDLALTGMGAYNGPVTFGLPLTVGELLRDPVTKGSLIDTNYHNDEAYLALVAPIQPTPMASMIAKALLAAGLLVVGALTIAARRRQGRG